MTLVRKMCMYAGRSTKLSRLIEWSQCPYFVPLYHTISDSHLPHINPLYAPRSIQVFRKDLDLFLKHYQPVSMSELIDIARGKNQYKKPVVHITFDDGLSQVYQHAMPILIAKGIPCTIFINSDFVDNKGLFYKYKLALLTDKVQRSDHRVREKVEDILESSGVSQLLELGYNDASRVDEIAAILEVDFSEYLRKEKPYMSTTQLMDWKNKGFGIGGHSTDHQRYAEKSSEAQKADFLLCVETVNQRFKMDSTAFAFPFDDVGISKETMETMRGQTSVEATFGISGIKQDYTPLHIHRVPMEDYNWSASDILTSEYCYHRLKSIFGKNTIHRD